MLQVYTGGPSLAWDGPPGFFLSTGTDLTKGKSQVVINEHSPSVAYGLEIPYNISVAMLYKATHQKKPTQKLNKKIMRIINEICLIHWVLF